MKAPRSRGRELTTPDLVLLSLLAERPMHGYQANAELERREVRDWAGISRPQVYYSLEKLARRGLIRAAKNDEPAAGPDRQVFATTAKGKAALAEALEREDWTMQRERPAFLTWIALSWLVRPGVFPKQLKRRRQFLEKEVAQGTGRGRRGGAMPRGGPGSRASAGATARSGPVISAIMRRIFRRGWRSAVETCHRASRDSWSATARCRRGYKSACSPALSSW